MFPQFRPPDVLHEMWLFINYAGMCIWVHEHWITVLCVTITWSEMEKQNIQAKKVY